MAELSHQVGHSIFFSFVIISHVWVKKLYKKLVYGKFFAKALLTFNEHQNEQFAIWHFEVRGLVTEERNSYTVRAGYDKVVNKGLN